MKIIIVGSGRVGEILTKYIIEEGHDVVVIDSSPEAIESVTNKYDCNGIVGNGATSQILKKAGVKSCKLLIAVTQVDEVNLMCSIVAKRLGAKHTIARVRKKEYLAESDYLRNELGVDLIVNPELDTAHKITRLIRFPEASKIEGFANGKINLVEIPIFNNNPLIGKALKDINQVTNAKLVFCAVRRKEETIIPKGDFVFALNDIVSLVAMHNELSKFFLDIGVDKKAIKSTMIIGGGMIGFYLAYLLNEMNLNVKIIENNRKRCLDLDEALPKTTIVYGDGTDSKLLVDEGINKTDCMVALAGNDETNLVCSMFAKSSGVSKIVTEITNIAFAEMLHEVNIKDTISPHYVTIDEVIRYVRGIKYSTSDIKALYRIANASVEAIEFDCKDGFKGVNTPLKDLKLKKDILIACIIRDQEIIVPNGSTEILVGDSVIIVSKAHINRLNEIL